MTISETRLGVLLSVGEDQRGAPRTAEEQPALHAEVFTQPLHVRDQMVRGVAAQIRGRVGGVRGAASAAALVEEDDPVSVGVEPPPYDRAAARPRPAVHDERGLATGVAADLPVHEMAVADIEHPLLVRLDLRIQHVLIHPTTPLRCGAGRQYGIAIRGCVRWTSRPDCAAPGTPGGCPPGRGSRSGGGPGGRRPR